MIRHLQNRFGLPQLPASSSQRIGNVPDSILNNVVVEMFRNSNDAKGVGTGDVGFNTLILATDASFVAPHDCDALIASVPQVSVYGQFEEQYLSILGKAYDFDTVYAGNWDLSMRALTIPDTSRVFSARNKDVRTIFASKVAQQLISRLKMLATSPYAL